MIRVSNRRIVTIIFPNKGDTLNEFDVLHSSDRGWKCIGVILPCQRLRLLIYDQLVSAIFISEANTCIEMVVCT